MRDELNRRFMVPGRLAFEVGAGGLIYVAITNKQALATVSLLGGQVLAYQPVGDEPVLWLSSRSHFEAGKAIRGGIPICWPWFGTHPDVTKPFHGFARTLIWNVRETGVNGDDTYIRLGISDNEFTRPLWPYAFDLEVSIIVSDKLSVELVSRNTGDAAFSITAALHSYLRVGDIHSVSIQGLQGETYLDKVDGYRPKLQEAAIAIDSETDRIYLHTTSDCLVHDRAYGRVIRVAKSGSYSTVVWNPWREKARHMSDMGDDDYREMVCVEAANTLDNEIIVAPGTEHRLQTVISSAPLRR